MNMNSMAGKLSIVTRSLLAAAAISVGTGIVDARADVLIDTYNPSGGVDNFPMGLDTRFNLAVQFTASTRVTIDSVLAAITWSSGTPTMSLGVMSNLNNLPSDTFLYQAVLNQPSANVLLSGLNWSLDAGTYWLAAIPDPGFFGSWAANFSPVTPTLFASTSSDFGLPKHWAPAATPLAARITTAVPEPETYAMILAGLGMIGFVARRRAKY